MSIFPSSPTLVFTNQFTILMGADAGSLADVTMMFPPLEQVSLHYCDPISFEADTLEIIFPDIDDKIITSAKIKKGLWIQVKIDQFNKDYIGSHLQRDLGTFMIDQIKQSGPPTQTVLMASAVPIASQIKFTIRNRVRLVESLKELAQSVADENKLKLVYDTKIDKKLSQVNQWNESDLAMLSRICKEAHLAIKISDRQLIVFDEQAYEQKSPVYAIDFKSPGAGLGMTHWVLTTQSQDIYAGSLKAYFDVDTNTVTIGVAKSPHDTGSGEQLNEYGEPQAQPTTEGEDIGGGD